MKKEDVLSIAEIIMGIIDHGECFYDEEDFDHLLSMIAVLTTAATKTHIAYRGEMDMDE